MILLYLAAAQAVVSAPSVTSTAPQPTDAIVPSTADTGIVVLPRDTRVEMMATAEVSTADAKPGTIFRLRVNKPILVGGRVVVPVGAPGFGQVVTATDSGGLGKSGRMTAKLLHLKLGDAETPLDGEMNAKGRLVVRPLYLRVGDTVVRLTGSGSKKAGVEAGAVVGMVLIAPVFTGRSAVIPAGTAILATVKRSVDVRLGAL